MRFYPAADEFFWVQDYHPRPEEPLRVINIGTESWMVGH